MARRRRQLTADDHAAWNAVAQSISRRPDELAAKPPEAPDQKVAATLRMRGSAQPLAAPPRDDRDWPARATGHRVVPVGPAVNDALPGPVGRPEAGLDRRTADRLRRGIRAPDAHLDLHGMTADRAHAALARFIAQSRRKGLRCLLVITGKGGRRSPDDAPWLAEGRGVLRDAVPRWLRTGPHGRDIVGIYEAAPRHGGAGALYIYLKRSRSHPTAP